jgi:hypothetical protein
MQGPSDKSLRHHDTKIRTLLSKRGEPDFHGDHSAADRGIIPR